MTNKRINKLLLAVITLLSVEAWILKVACFDGEIINDILNGVTLEDTYADKYTRAFIKYDFNAPACIQVNQGRRILSIANSTSVRSNILSSIAPDLMLDINPDSQPIVNEQKTMLVVKDQTSDLELHFHYSSQFKLDSVTINRKLLNELEQNTALLTVLDKVSKLPCVESVALQPQIHIITQKSSENVRAASKSIPKVTKTGESVYPYPNDPFHNQQWWYLSKGEAKLHYPALGDKFVLPNLQEVHQIWNGNGSNYKIGVVDTGLDVFHPDMLENGKMEDFEEFSGTDSQYFFNKPEADGYDLNSHNLDSCFDESDTDNNGFVDDCFGMSFIDWSVPYDYAGHGTHVSGIIAAKTDNNKHVSSSCPDCKLVTMSPLFPIEAIIYSIITNVPVMNWSFGFHRGQLYCEECDYIKNYLIIMESLIIDYKQMIGGIIVVAAGNEPTDVDDCLGLTPNDPMICQANFYYGYPCQLSVKHDNVICVGASDHFGKVAKFSSFGKESVTVFAPGVDMLSLGVTYYSETQANYQGTSMAAPVVSGIIGLIRSRYPALTVAQINKIMRVSCQKTKYLQTKSVCGGVIDAVKAMAHASICNQVPTQCGMPLSPGADEESHESVISWFCQKAASFGHTYVPFCQT